MLMCSIGGEDLGETPWMNAVTRWLRKASRNVWRNRDPGLRASQSLRSLERSLPPSFSAETVHRAQRGLPEDRVFLRKAGEAYLRKKIVGTFARLRSLTEDCGVSWLCGKDG